MNLVSVLQLINFDNWNGSHSDRCFITVLTFANSLLPDETQCSILHVLHTHVYSICLCGNLNVCHGLIFFYIKQAGSELIGNDWKNV